MSDLVENPRKQANPLHDSNQWNLINEEYEKLIETLYTGTICAGFYLKPISKQSFPFKLF